MESETVLFDASTNPSLDSRAHRAVRDRRLFGGHWLQRGELIPEEEEQAA